MVGKGGRDYHVVLHDSGYSDSGERMPLAFESLFDDTGIPVEATLCDSRRRGKSSKLLLEFAAFTITNNDEHGGGGVFAPNALSQGV
jgi:hypothetical protein